MCHFLHHELSEYHRLLAVLESQMNTASSNGEQPEGGLTLLRLRLWTEDMKLKLKQMSTIVDEAKSESIVWMTVNGTDMPGRQTPMVEL